MGRDLEKGIKRFLKRRVKITLGFIVAFLLSCSFVSADILEIKYENGEITFSQEIAENTFIDNTYTNNGIITGGKTEFIIECYAGIKIDSTVTDFSLTNFGIIKVQPESFNNNNIIGIINTGMTDTLNNNGIILSDGDGIFNETGTIKILNNMGNILESGNNGIINTDNGTITTLNNIGNISSGSIGINNMNGTIDTLNNVGNIFGGSAGIINTDGGTIEKLDNSGNILGNEVGIVNISGGTINTLNNTGKILGSKIGINNSDGRIDTLNNVGNILGKEIGIYNDPKETIKKLDNSGNILGDPFGIVAVGTITTLTNNGIIAGSDVAINGVDEENITNNGLLINGTTVETGVGGEQEVIIGYDENNNPIKETKYIINGAENSQGKAVKSSELKKEIDDKKFSLGKLEDYQINDNTYSNLIINVVGDIGTAFNIDNDLKISDSIINGYKNAVAFVAKNKEFTGENVIINSGKLAVAGSNGTDSVKLLGKSIINGDINLGKGADKFTVENTVQLNGDLEGGDGEDNLTLAKSTDESLNILNKISNFENINVNNNVTLFENAKITGAEKIYIGDGGQFTLRVDGSETTDGKVTGHGLYGQDNTTISSNENGKLNINFIGGQNENIISFGSNKLENVVVDFTNPLFFADNEGKNPTSEIKVSVNKDLSGVIGTPDNSKKETDIDISLYNKLDKIFKSMRSVNGLLSTEFTGLTDDTKGEFLKYLHDIYAGNPYAYSSELSRKTIGMMRNLADRDLHPELNKWSIYGGLTHVDGGTKESFYGRNYYGYDTGSRDIETDTKITGGYFKAEYGKSDSITTGLIFGGNNAESELGNSKAEGDSFYFGGYAKKFVNDFRFILGAGFQHGDYKADRTAVGYEGITATRSYSENYHDRGFDIYGDIRYSREIGDNLFFEPGFTLSYTYLDQDGAAENGTLAIETDSKNFDYLSSEINLDVRKTILADKLTHSFIAGISYERLLNGYDEEYITGRVIGGTDFDILVPEKEKDNFLLNAKYELETEKGMLFDLKCSYKFEHDNNQDEWTVGAGIGYKF